MLKRIESNGVRTIIVESANRFARDLMVQEVGHARLRERGIDLIAADNPSSFLDDTPTARLVRQVLGAIAEFDKAMTVAKLRGARERKRAAVGKCEGRKGHLEVRPEVVREAKRLRRRSPKTAGSGRFERSPLNRRSGSSDHERPPLVRFIGQVDAGDGIEGLGRNPIKARAASTRKAFSAEEALMHLNDVGARHQRGHQGARVIWQTSAL